MVRPPRGTASGRSPDDSKEFFAVDNPYVTGTVLHVDGGGRLA